MQTKQSKQYLFVAIDRTSKVAFAERHPRAKRVVAADFLLHVLDELPDKGAYCTDRQWDAVHASAALMPAKWAQF